MDDEDDFFGSDDLDIDVDLDGIGQAIDGLATIGPKSASGTEKWITRTKQRFNSYVYAHQGKKNTY